MSYTGTSTNVHLHGNTTVKLSFNDHTDCDWPFRTLKLDAGDHELNVFFRERDASPKLVDVLHQIIEAATEQLKMLSLQEFVDDINTEGVKA